MGHAEIMAHRAFKRAGFDVADVAKNAPEHIKKCAWGVARMASCGSSCPFSCPHFIPLKESIRKG